MIKCGYVGVIGKTNVGKSTLVNALVGEKVSIVSPKTQTTRNNITGILTENNSQIIFVDTPGIHKSMNNLDKQLMKNVRNAIDSVDVILYIIDVSKKLDITELDYIKKLSNTPIIVGISKTDLVKKGDILKIITKIAEIQEVKAIIPFSSKSKENLIEIKEEILKLLPETENYIYDTELYTDSSLRFMVGEIVREKALYLLQEELPHGIAIEVTKFNESKKITEIDVDLICEKESHKSIILGKNGNMIKEIGTLARKDIEELLQNKVMLKIWVKIIKNWRQTKTNLV